MQEAQQDACTIPMFDRVHLKFELSDTIYGFVNFFTSATVVATGVGAPATVML
jgi:hypothetical protein